jgi:hypothetical protein
MPLSRSIDILLATAVSLVLVFLVLIKGDPLYLGAWYYFVVPLVILGSCFALRVPPLFLFGASLAIAITLLAVMSVNWRAARPEGLLGLGHLFSMPGAFAGALFTAVFIKRIDKIHLASAFGFGFVSLLAGYFINQLVVCNTVMWCGPLSLPIK